jgi:hypothetical protein
MTRFFSTLCAALWLVQTGRGFEPQDYAFLLTAETSADPPQIVVSWPQKNGGEIFVRRKLSSDGNWGSLVATLPADSTSFADSNVQAGVAYDYEFNASVTNRGDGSAIGSGPKAYGYIRAGLDIPAVEKRGKVALIVDDRFVNDLRAELETLRKDLIGDGWTVVRHDVSPADAPATIKTLIREEYEADVERMRAVFLFGHIAVPYSGLLDPDMHGEHLGAWPADVFYGDMNGDWTDATVNWELSEFSANNNVPGDGKFDQSEIPGRVELEVGRVDFWDMPAFEPRTEVELLRNYLNKDHAYRQAIIRAPARGVIRDGFGVVQDDAPATDAWRAFPAMFGTNSWVEVGDGEFFPTLNAEPFLFAFGCGGGDRSKADGVGTTWDFATTNPKAVFYLLHGSWFGDWNTEDNFLRAAIATQEYGLVSIWSSLPHWFLHPLAAGETVGCVTRLVQNNRNGTYTNDPNYFPGQVHISMMGDPTLRVFTLAPPTDLRVTQGESAIVEWDPSNDAVAGYNVYRSTSFDGPFEKLNDRAVTDTWFEESALPSGHYIYMVKAAALQKTGSGTFWNLSQGAFVEFDRESPITPTILAPKINASGDFEFVAHGFGNRAYRIESRAPDGAWQTRESGISGEDGVITYREDLAPTDECVLYRVAWD